MLIDLGYLIEKYDLDIQTCVHVGAHNAEEYLTYKRYGISTIWIEGNSVLIEGIQKKTQEKVIEAVISDKKETVTWYDMTLSGSNSILEPNLNTTWRDDLKLKGTIQKETTTLKELGVTGDMLNLDIQGAELKALRGADLSKVKYIYTEVHELETYHGCAKVWELDEFLKDYKRVETKWTRNKWGDSVYIRKDLL